MVTLKKIKPTMSKAIISLFFLYFVWGPVVSFQELCYSLNQTYNTTTQICCPNSIEQKYSHDGQIQDCCFNRTYIPNTELCCGKSVVRRIAEDGKTTMCCGDIQYAPHDNSKLCCRGRLHDRKPGEPVACCGRSKINSEKEVCCRDKNSNSTIHRKQQNMRCCKQEYYHTETHYCLNKRHILPKYFRLCGKQQYDTRISKCCGTTIHTTTRETEPNYDCCGSKVFNNINQTCCGNDNLIPSGRVCCHGGSYDKAKERCCDAGPVQFTKTTEQCCGAGLYDKETQGCCGKRTYNTTSQECCIPNGAIIMKDSDEKCCGTLKYDMTTSVCCHNDNQVKVAVKSHTHHDSCCTSENMDATTSFSSSTHYCSSGSVFSNGVKLCGTSVIDENTDLCCQGLFYKDGKTAGKECCGSGIKSFSPEKQICCNNNVYRKKGKKHRCNGGKANNQNKSKRSLDKNSTSYGICRICKQSIRGFNRFLKSNDVDICRQQAYKVSIKKQGPINSNIKKIVMEIQKDLYSDTDYRRKTIEVQLPCDCRLQRPKVILLTNSQVLHRPIRLGDSDLLLPWNQKIGRELKRRWRKCTTKSTKIVRNKMLEIKNYIDYKVSQVTDDVLK